MGWSCLSYSSCISIQTCYWTAQTLRLLFLDLVFLLILAIETRRSCQASAKSHMRGKDRQRSREQPLRLLSTPPSLSHIMTPFMPAHRHLFPVWKPRDSRLLSRQRQLILTISFTITPTVKTSLGLFVKGLGLCETMRRHDALRIVGCTWKTGIWRTNT